MWGETLKTQGQQLVFNLYNYFELEIKNGGPLKHISCVQKAKDIISLCYKNFYRVAAALKTSKRTVYAIRRRKENNQELSTPGKKIPRKKTKTTDLSEGRRH